MWRLLLLPTTGCSLQQLADVAGGGEAVVGDGGVDGLLDGVVLAEVLQEEGVAAGACQPLRVVEVSSLRRLTW